MITKQNIMSEQVIKLNDRQEVYLTDKAFSVKNGQRKVGEAVQLHPKQAESWIASGKATAKKADAVKTQK